MNFKTFVLSISWHLVFLVTLELAEARGAGGGRGGRAYGRGGSGGQFVWTPFHTILTVLSTVSVILAAFCWCYCHKVKKELRENAARGRKGSKTRCYLCNSNVRNKNWDNGSHRRSCAQKNADYLAARPTPFQVTCPLCEDLLKLWGADRGISFNCSGSPCPKFNVSMSNGGDNRFSCFKCDFTLCRFCVDRQVRQNLEDLESGAKNAHSDDYDNPPDYKMATQ